MNKSRVEAITDGIIATALFIWTCIERKIDDRRQGAETSEAEQAPEVPEIGEAPEAPKRRTIEPCVFSLRSI